MVANRDDVIHYDSEKEEHYALVDFDDARKFVPNKIYKKVHRDNLKFLCEKQVFSDAFYKCTLELLQLSMQQAPRDGDITGDQKKFQLIYKIVDRVMFDLLVNSQAIA